MKFSKEAFDIPALIAKFEQRGLTWANDSEVLAALENVGYYRISGYAYPFLESPERKTFKPGTTWAQIIQVYEFDRELRLLVNDAVERVEVAIRARLISLTTQLLGPHWFLDRIHFHHRFDHQTFIRRLEREIGVRHDAQGSPQAPANHPEAFVQHYYQKYGDPHLPPFWATAEILSLGAISRIYSGLGEPRLKLRIAQPFGLSAKVLGSWLHSLAHLRNVCAHHSRLWNRTFSISPLVPNHFRETINASNRFEGHATVLVSILDNTHPQNEWRSKLRNLLQRYPSIDPVAMGFNLTKSNTFWSLK